MSFEQVTRNAQAQQKRVVLADPDSLRECADRLQAAVNGAGHGESVLCELTPGITIVFKPELGSRVYEAIESRQASEVMQ